MIPRILFSSIFMISAFAPRAIAEEQAKADEQATQAKLEKQFQEMLTGSVLVGTFTVTGQKEDAPLRKERYEISEVSKISGNLWLFKARIKYGTLDVTLPIPLKVEWAGDTPMILLTDQKIPGLGGVFSTRVMFYRGQYAGTWKHNKAGGHMFGTIEKQKPKKSAE